MKKTERGSSAVRNAATSPLRSSAGPAVCTNGTPSSAATIWASDVLPSPGGPASRTWSSASPPGAAGRPAGGAGCPGLDAGLPGHGVLADKVGQPLRAQRAVVVLGDGVRVA